MSHASHSHSWIAVVTTCAVVAAHVAYQTWREQKARADAAALPEARFDYRGFDWTWLLVPLQVWALLATLWLLPRMGNSFREVGWPLSLAMIAFLLLLAFVFSVPLYCTLLLLRDRRRRRGQEIGVTNDGITFAAEGGETIVAAWADVEDYYRTGVGGRVTMGARSVVVTRQGTFDFTTGIRRGRLLSAVITRRAIHAAVTDWDQRAGTGAGGAVGRAAERGGSSL